MLSVFADSLGQASNFQSIVINGCSPAANLIFPACLGKCLVSNKSSLCISCEEFKHSKSFAARARLLQIQIGADCLCRSPALATKAHRFRLVRLRMWSEIASPICIGGFGRTASLQDACLASCTARLAPSRASQLLGAKRGVIPDHILRPDVALNGSKAAKDYPGHLRRVRLKD